MRTVQFRIVTREHEMARPIVDTLAVPAAIRRRQLEGIRVRSDTFTQTIDRIRGAATFTVEVDLDADEQTYHRLASLFLDHAPIESSDAVLYVDDRYTVYEHSSIVRALRQAVESDALVSLV